MKCYIKKDQVSESIEYFKRVLIRNEKSIQTIEKYIRDIRKFYEYADGKCISKQMVIDYKYYLENFILLQP